MYKAPLQRKVTFRLTQRQVTSLAKRYRKWRESLPTCKRYLQQESSHVLFTPSFSKAICFFSILTLIFSFLGFLFYFSANKLNSMVIDYGELCKSQGRQCEITFTPDSDFSRPHLYYELDKFYSNYRNVAKTHALYS